MSETYVVTGGAGFIGSHIAERLLRDGKRVRIVDNLVTGKRENLAHLQGDFDFHQVSITDKAALDPIFTGADVVFHHAALPSVSLSVDDPLTTHDYCVNGTLNVLLAARDAGVKRVVYAASSSAYGDNGQEFQEESFAPQPMSPYAAAKLAGEYYCRAFTESYGLETACLRYFNVFGPRQDPLSQYAAVVPIFVSAMLAGKQPTIFGDGLQTRDFIYIDNIVHANLLAATSPDAVGQTINIASEGRINLLQLVEKINALLGTSIQPVFAEPRAGDIQHSRASIQKARDLLDFMPVVDFDSGLERTVRWFQNGS